VFAHADVYIVVSEYFISNSVTDTHRKEICNYLCAELQMNIHINGAELLEGNLIKTIKNIYC
jgi:hypothetical protein